MCSAGGSGASSSRALAAPGTPERQQEKGKGLKKAWIDSQVLILYYAEPLLVDPKQILEGSLLNQIIFKTIKRVKLQKCCHIQLKGTEEFFFHVENMKELHTAFSL